MSCCIKNILCTWEVGIDITGPPILDDAQVQLLFIIESKDNDFTFKEAK